MVYDCQETYDTFIRKWCLMSHSETLGSQIRELRKSRNDSQETFGKLFDPPATKGVVSKWENDITIPSDDRLSIISKLSGKSKSELLNGSLHGVIADFSDFVFHLYNRYCNDIGTIDSNKIFADQKRTSNKKMIYALNTILFIGNDAYTKFSKAKKDEAESGKSTFQKIKQFHEVNLSKGLRYCATDTERVAQTLKVTADQKLLIYKLFSESAERHFSNQERTNEGALTIVELGIEDTGQKLYSLFHSVDKEGKSVELPNNIDEKLYNQLNAILDEFDSRLYKIRQDYGIE